MAKKKVTEEEVVTPVEEKTTETKAPKTKKVTPKKVTPKTTTKKAAPKKKTSKKETAVEPETPIVVEVTETPAEPVAKNIENDVDVARKNQVFCVEFGYLGGGFKIYPHHERLEQQNHPCRHPSAGLGPS